MKLLYLDNPADRTVTWYGTTLTYEHIAYCKANGIDPWTGIRIKNV